MQTLIRKTKILLDQIPQSTHPVQLDITKEELQYSKKA